MPGPYGITPTGFNRKRADEILTDLNTGTQGVFGAGVDLSPESPDGQFNGLIADEIAYMWELAEDVFHSSDIFQAEGTRLDDLMANYQYPARNVGETDAQYITRIFGTTAGLTNQDVQVGTPSVISTNIQDDLEIKLLDLAGVTSAIVYVNDTNVADPVTGLPPHSYAVLVAGGNDAEIAQVIWSSHPGGITMVGDLTVEVVSASGRCRAVKFSRPAVKTILIEYNVRLFRSQCGCRVPTADDVKQLALTGLTSGSCPVAPGELILNSRVGGIIASEPGIELCSSLISFDPDPVADQNLQLAWNEIAEFLAGNITVNILEVCP